ncbi:MAG: hypothetical protein NPIRA06_14790 [Nitrospirales bacterium]|nr:MAG: hypothetical protein NPIRA06_14790 [Nitrospirales bacterium]
MYKQLTAPDHVIAMHLSDKLTGDDIKKYKLILDEKLSNYNHLSVVVDFTGLSDMNADAFVEGTKADLELLRHIEQFTRFAFITDKEWPQVLVGFMTSIFPTVEMRVFPHSESDEAMKWASELPKASKSQPPAFRFLPTSKDDVLAFEIDGVISAKEIPEVIKRFETFLERQEKVRLLNRIKHFGGIDPAVFMQSGLVSIKLAAMQKVERYAIVGAPGWMCKVIETVNPAIADMDMRTFTEDQENEAWAWLGVPGRGASRIDP